MLKFFKLIRYQNLLLLALAQLVFHFGFLKLQNIPLALQDWQFILLVIATVLIAAGGFLINQVFEPRSDSALIGDLFTEDKAYNYYAALNIVAVGIGFYLANSIEKPSFAAVFVVASATLYVYATSLKQMLLVGTIVVSMLAAFSIIVIGLFDLFPVVTAENQPLMAVLFQILVDYAVFTFTLLLIRALVKDLQNVNQDYNLGISTLPITLGAQRTSKLVFGLCLIPIALLVYYINTYIFELQWAMGYAMLFIVGPLLYLMIKMWGAKTTKDYQNLGIILQMVLLFTILSIVVITINRQYYA
ncbi:geranylgeranylglycerol-phosphate geranylgeranyltransferase [Flavobacterium sp. '19STA2R22 D10 B1']|uniref:geranylgeranylglycerol-phosphate geranylgeranyltransferase n=1 Tax=Flavobacterium aerium TaxID=3037261 RepID=UPI00278C019C|nr:geranylgeranylglycerol-phosphate geranylgeranyltransferase [Flavobacterium sp. '19STA2R22 D10 B1']